MQKDHVLKLWRQRPFVPFRITTVVGEAIDVMHPALMLVAGNMITVGTPILTNRRRQRWTAYGWHLTTSLGPNRWKRPLTAESCH